MQFFMEVKCFGHNVLCEKIAIATIVVSKKFRVTSETFSLFSLQTGPDLPTIAYGFRKNSARKMSGV